MQRRRGNPKRVVPLLLVGILCILVSALALGIESIPREARRIFGSPASSLSAFQRMQYSFNLLIHQQDLLQPASQTGPKIKFTIESNESVNSVATRLQKSAIIRNAKVFREFLIYSGLDTTLQAGNYQLNPAQNGLQIAQQLQDATPAEVTFNILAGWRVEEIAAAIPTSGLSISQTDFLGLVKDPPANFIPDGIFNAKTLEGLLVPGKYQLARNARLDEVVHIFVNQFSSQVSPEIRASIEKQGLTLYEGVILASMVQREAIVEEEMPQIASVFYNRLAINMKLDSDPTVQYAVGFDKSRKTWWVNPLTASDLKVQSAYNTYLGAGLPPAPICNPSLSALQAVANPANTPYLYFRATCDGSGKHTFSITYDEHLQKNCP